MGDVGGYRHPAEQAIPLQHSPQRKNLATKPLPSRGPQPFYPAGKTKNANHNEKFTPQYSEPTPPTPGPSQKVDSLDDDEQITEGSSDEGQDDYGSRPMDRHSPQPYRGHVIQKQMESPRKGEVRNSSQNQTSLSRQNQGRAPTWNPNIQRSGTQRVLRPTADRTFDSADYSSNPAILTPKTRRLSTGSLINIAITYEDQIRDEQQTNEKLVSGIQRYMMAQ